ncbi:MAG TPA: YggU family protein [Candidatus Magasanikbacteria bacterium]|nr:YggU family protein [Candidatus Magasanikbacteria bacterium]
MKIIKIKVTPRSSKNEIVETMSDGTIKIKLKAPPVDGEANKELIKFLSTEWKIPKSKIKIVKGQTSRTKTIEIED